MPLQLRQDASRSNVLKLNEAQKLADYRYVVFSCHGVVPDVTNRVSQPALVLSQPDPAGGAGFLTMADTFGLRLNADLVTLSACNTGRGMEVRGEGVMGLTRCLHVRRDSRHIGHAVVRGIHVGKDLEHRSL